MIELALIFAAALIAKAIKLHRVATVNAIRRVQGGYWVHRARLQVTCPECGVAVGQPCIQRHPEDE